jgi:catechol 2,3-dioxygenase-like lactoylglutathione lyase family enzyme
MSDQRPAPVLNQLNLVVKDMATTLQFYRLLGLETEANPPEWAGDHVSARLPDGIKMEFDSAPFARQWNPGWPGGGGGGVMFFRVPERDDVDRI